MSEPRSDAAAAASRSAVSIRAVDTMPELREVSSLLDAVWGTSEQGVPINSETLRCLAHAGGCTLAAYDERGVLAGTAVLALAAEPLQTYGMIAASAPGLADRGIGYALKLAQRAWALERGLTRMSWTFDPLVSRNARFNLVKLGAAAPEYEQNFFGQMTDAMNDAEESDRLVAVWRLDEEPGRSTGVDPAVDPDHEVVGVGPDGEPMARRDTRGLWVRVPTDVVALRRSDPDAARPWRLALRRHLEPALHAGGVATYLTRDGWYLVEEPDR